MSVVCYQEQRRVINTDLLEKSLLDQVCLMLVLISLNWVAMVHMYFSEMNFPSMLMLTALMFIGTAPASTGGGITTGTFVVLWLAVFSYARGLDKIRVGKHSLPKSLLLRALVVFVISFTLVFLSTWLLLLTNPFNFEQTLFEVMSAYSTTGLSLGVTPGLNMIGRLIIIFTMFAGRLGAITIMISLMGRDNGNKLIDYPEESILIG